MGQTREQKVIKQLTNPSSVQKFTAIATDMFLPNHSGDHSAGHTKTPTTDLDLANKKYVDDAITGIHARQHAITQTLDHTSTATSGQMLKADANGLPVNATNTDTEVAGAVTHAADNTQAHSDYLLNSAADVGVGLTLTGDNSSADTAYVPMVLYNTDDTPPAASGFPVGTIYIKYTA
jgi:hypothetical protein